MNQQFRPIKRWANWATFFLVVYGAMTIASTLSVIAEIDLLQRVYSGQAVSNAEIYANSRRQVIIGLLYTPAFVGVVIAFLLRMPRASVSLTDLGAHTQRFSPGKSDFPASPMPSFWWGIGAWLASIWVSGGLTSLFISEITLDHTIMVNSTAMTLRVISLAALIRAAILMRRITSDQAKTYAAGQGRIDAGDTLADADAEIAETAPAPRPSTETLPPPAKPPRAARCARCGKEMPAVELIFGVCSSHITI